MKGYDIIGNVAIIKFDRKEKLSEKKKYAMKFLEVNRSVRSIYEKVGKFSGRLRKQKVRWIAGEKNTKALCRENDCSFLLDISSCYFSPRLANERKEIASQVKKGESVLVMFGGVAPFAIVIAKLVKAGRIVSIELGRECTKYAKVNVKRNKVEDRVEVLGGDVRKILPKMSERFNRIVMPRPNLKDSFLDVAFYVIKKSGIIHYYGFTGFEEGTDELKFLIASEAKKAGRKIKILSVKKAGEVGVRKFRYRVDFRVLT